MSLVRAQPPQPYQLTMNELSLFTGAGGGVYGSKLLGWNTVGYVEYDEFCQAVIAQRIKDGIFDKAPIFSDVRLFADQFAESYRGVAQVVTAGFPCQPFSEAGKRRGSADSRNMWPATISIIRKVQPQWCLLENVPGLLGKHGYFGTILKDLAESGYNAEWACLSAQDVGAPHKRERLWIVAHADDMRLGWRVKQSASSKSAGDVADPDSIRQLQSCGGQPNERRRLGNGCWWETEPNVGRVADGVAARSNRIKALGNGQVPAVVRAAWTELVKL